MMVTRRLYYEDVYKKEFQAKVLECREAEKGYRVLLNQSAFTRKEEASPVIQEL